MLRCLCIEKIALKVENKKFALYFLLALTSTASDRERHSTPLVAEGQQQKPQATNYGSLQSVAAYLHGFTEGKASDTATAVISCSHSVMDHGECTNSPSLGLLTFELCLHWD